jgi:hypothetical protein
MFAIQDSFSRFIGHACLREQPTSDFRYLHSWYKIKDCFKETFEQYGKPFEIVVDRTIQHDYSKKILEDKCVIVTGADHPAYSATLERFFLSVQYEMRTDLTQENLEKYIHFYNFKRPHSVEEFGSILVFNSLSYVLELSQILWWQSFPMGIKGYCCYSAFSIRWSKAQF